MGFVSNLLKTILSPSIPQASSQQPTITGRDLVQQTESTDPDAPVMGGSNPLRRRRGIESLLVPSEDIYKGGN
ncbi:hypothetical protein [Selenomonas flueggei]|uniref:hypothetical protein n=1 Tax=Selenomonas flueggei TaxID=135080 RepID=UPI0026716959|nr:hypothetical protein [Selenomonas flueggei]